MSYTTLATLQAQATAINNAITALVTGGAVSYMLGDRQVTKVNLTELRNALKDIEKQIFAIEGGSSARRLMTYGTWKSAR